MSELISDPRYWARRLRDAKKGDLHHAIFQCPKDRWLAIEAKHRQILAKQVREKDFVLDAGCGWGRLLTLMPDHWAGHYIGIDLSPDFIKMAKAGYAHEPRFGFSVWDLRQLDTLDMVHFDLAVMISIRPMIKRHLGEEVWAGIEGQLRKRATRLLYLEYDPDDKGSDT